MTRRQIVTLLGTLSLVSVGRMLLAGHRPEAVAGEAADHPRIARAIQGLQDAIDYLQAAPHDFGGHKVEAIRASREAIVQLQKVLTFRGRQDRPR